MEQNKEVKQKPAAEPANKKGLRLKPLHIAAIVIAVVVVLGGVYVVTSYAAPTVAVLGDNVSVYYTGSFTNGTVFGSNVGQQPLTFTAGSNQLIKGFSNAVIGMEVNQTKNVTLTPAEAYGQINQSLFVSVPLQEFRNQTPTVGMIVSSAAGEEGMVTFVNSTVAVVDFNPPLAGKTLVFRITVVSIKK